MSDKAHFEVQVSATYVIAADTEDQAVHIAQQVVMGWGVVDDAAEIRGAYSDRKTFTVSKINVDLEDENVKEFLKHVHK